MATQTIDSDVDIGSLRLEVDDVGLGRLKWLFNSELKEF
jgi:hypothetical protein